MSQREKRNKKERTRLLTSVVQQKFISDKGANIGAGEMAKW